MEFINEYLFKVFNLIYLNKINGLIEPPRKFKLCKKDKRILNKIYRVYEVYKYKINKKTFYNIVVEYSIKMNTVVIKSGVEVAEQLEKIIKK
jgi:hypothetical protein